MCICIKIYKTFYILRFSFRSVVGATTVDLGISLANSRSRNNNSRDVTGDPVTVPDLEYGKSRSKYSDW